jgi:hypothetical protein
MSHDVFQKVTDKLLRDLICEVRESNRLAKENSSLEREQTRILERILHALKTSAVLTHIKIEFQGAIMATPVAGPVTLTAVGQTVTASVVGFDQFGNPFTGTIPTPTFSASDTTGAIATFDPATGLVTAVANGVDNITASLTTAEGLALTDTEAVTVAIPVVAPVLTTIKVAFA